jgi:hypothetical protein
MPASAKRAGFVSAGTTMTLIKFRDAGGFPDRLSSRSHQVFYHDFRLGLRRSRNRDPAQPSGPIGQAPKCDEPPTKLKVTVTSRPGPGGWVRVRDHSRAPSPGAGRARGPAGRGLGRPGGGAGGVRGGGKQHSSESEDPVGPAAVAVVRPPPPPPPRAAVVRARAEAAPGRWSVRRRQEPRGQPPERLSHFHWSAS